MIVTSDDKPTANAQVVHEAQNPQAGPSTEQPPPSFEDAARAPHVAIQLLEPETETYAPQGGEEPPPFTPYEAEYSTSGDTIISHDKHLNEDGAHNHIYPSFLLTRC